jgi:hypothetical protein
VRVGVGISRGCVEDSTLMQLAQIASGIWRHGKFLYFDVVRVIDVANDAPVFLWQYDDTTRGTDEEVIFERFTRLNRYIISSGVATLHIYMTIS